MKRLFILLFFATVLGSCSEKDCCVLPPELSEFHGEWDLVRLTNGFSQLDQTGEAIGFTEKIIINAENKTFTRLINDSSEVSSVTNGIEGGREALILTDEQMYHWYWFEQIDGKTHLLLYQKCPIGAVLADGLTYYYSKR